MRTCKQCNEELNAADADPDFCSDDCEEKYERQMAEHDDEGVCDDDEDEYDEDYDDDDFEDDDV